MIIPFESETRSAETKSVGRGGNGGGFDDNIRSRLEERDGTPRKLNRSAFLMHENAEDILEGRMKCEEGEVTFFLGGWVGGGDVRGRGARKVSDGATVSRNCVATVVNWRNLIGCTRKASANKTAPSLATRTRREPCSNIMSHSLPFIPLCSI